MKGGWCRRFVRARATGHEAMAGLLATDAVRMQCIVRAGASSVHNIVKYVVLGPHAFEALCAVLTRRGWPCSRGAPRPTGNSWGT